MHNHSSLKIGNKVFQSRLLTGTGKYKTLAEMNASILHSETEIVTVAIRRVQLSDSSHKGLMESIKQIEAKASTEKERSHRY